MCNDTMQEAIARLEKLKAGYQKTLDESYDPCDPQRYRQLLEARIDAMDDAINALKELAPRRFRRASTIHRCQKRARISVPFNMCDSERG